MKTLILFFFAILIPVVSFGQTNPLNSYFKDWHNPLPTAERLQDVQFLTDNTGYTVGNFGTFMRTTNAGTNWLFKSISDTSLLTICVIGNEIHIAGGTYDNQSRRAYYKSVNNGVSFTNLTLNTITEPDDNTRRINSLSFTDASTGYAGAENGKIYKTTSGGLTWIMLRTPVTTSIAKVHFPPTGSGLIGYATGGTGANAFVLKTTNGGTSWEQQVIPTIPNNTNLGAIDFIDADNGFISGGGSLTPSAFVLKTTNGGMQWSFIDVNALNPGIRFNLSGGVKMVSHNEVYAVGIMCNVARTTNGGATWQKIFPGDDFNYPSAAFTGLSIGQNNLYAVGAGGTVAKITDNIIEIINGEILMGLNAVTVSDYTAFAVGGASRVNSSGSVLTYPYIIRSSSFPNHSFEPIINISGYILHGVAVNSNAFIACGENGVVLRSLNHNFNFDIQMVIIGAEPGELLSFALSVDEQTFLIAGEGKIYRSTNTGASWSSVTIQSARINDMVIQNSTQGTTIFAVSSNGFVHKSTDVGLTWQQQSLPGINYSNGIYFLNELTGWTCGNLGNIAKTTNGGNTWTAQTTGIFSSSMNSVYFIDEQRGFCFGLGGLVLYTTDGGSNWIRDYVITANHIRQAKFRNRYIGYGVTSLGGLFGMWALEPHVESNGSETADVFQLFQNYPNPFNPATNIKFTLPVNTNVTLKIFNSLGQEIESLIVNERMSNGNHTVQWDASKYSSGVYYYTLNTESGIHSRKMILLK